MRERGTTCFIGLMVGLLAVGLTEAPADADGGPVTVEQRLFVSEVAAGQNPSAEIVHSAVFQFARADGSPPQAGIGVDVSVVSCGDAIASASVTLDGQHPGLVDWFSPDGEVDVGPNPVNAKVGQEFDYVVTITEPGYDSYQITGTYGGYSVHRPSCATLHEPTVTVKRWSRVRGKAIVGRTVSVTPTVAPGCHVSYTWKAGSGPVAHGRRLVIKPRWKYFSIFMVVKVTRDGYRSLSKKLLVPS